MLAVNRLAVFHPNVLKKELHTVVLALAYEVKNLRSTVARSSIFTLADLLKKMKGHIDPVRTVRKNCFGFCSKLIVCLHLFWHRKWKSLLKPCCTSAEKTFNLFEKTSKKLWKTLFNLCLRFALRWPSFTTEPSERSSYFDQTI